MNTLKLRELKDVIKTDLIIYDATETRNFNNVDVHGTIFEKYSDYDVIGIRTVIKYSQYTGKNIAYLVVSIKRPN